MRLCAKIAYFRTKHNLDCWNLEKPKLYSSRIRSILNYFHTMKIAFTGPECTGKTTVSQEVNSHFPNSQWEAELARLYLLETKNTRCTTQDFTSICEQSAELFQSNPTKNVIYDTDMYVLYVWGKKEFNTNSELIDRLCTAPFDHHFLCKPDFPFEEDPLRYGGTEEERQELFDFYIETLEYFKAPYSILEGNLSTRVQTAVRKLESLGYQ